MKNQKIEISRDLFDKFASVLDEFKEQNLGLDLIEARGILCKIRDEETPLADKVVAHLNNSTGQVIPAPWAVSHRSTSYFKLRTPEGHITSPVWMDNDNSPKQIAECLLLLNSSNGC